MNLSTRAKHSYDNGVCFISLQPLNKTGETVDLGDGKPSPVYDAVCDTISVGKVRGNDIWKDVLVHPRFYGLKTCIR